MNKWLKPIALLLVLVLTLQVLPTRTLAAAPEQPKAETADPAPTVEVPVTEPAPESELETEVPAAPLPEADAESAAQTLAGIRKPEPEMPVPEQQVLQMLPAASAQESRDVAADFAWTLEDGVLTITGTGDMPDWSRTEDMTEGTAPWNDSRSSITTVIVEEGITSIGEFSFYHFDALTEVSLPESLTRIGQYAFHSCAALSEIAIPEGVKEFGVCTFYGCAALTEMVIPEGVTELPPAMFSTCPGLVSVTLPQGLTAIGLECFRGCENLAQITLPQTLTVIGQSAFFGCSSLTEIVIPEGMTVIDEWTFSECTALTDVMLPQGLTAIGFGAFQGCSALSAISLPEGLTSLARQAFCDCSSLTGIDIPEGVTIIDDWTFGRCTALAAVGLPRNLTAIGEYAFLECAALTDITLPQGLGSIGYCAFYNCGLTEVTIPDSVTTLAEGAFHICSALERVQLPAGLTRIEPNIFYGCVNLQEIAIPETVTSIGNYAFSYCQSLAEIVFPETITQIGTYAFCGCSSLTDVAITGVLSEVGSYAFQNCKALEQLSLVGDGMHVANHCFKDCISLRDLTLTGLAQTGNYVCEGCTALERVELRGEDITICIHGFEDCSSLSQLILEGVTVIGASAFAYCTALTEFISSEGIEHIHESAFRGCTALERVEIRGNDAILDKYCFNNCENLTSVHASGVTRIDERAFWNCSLLTDVQLGDQLTWCGVSVFSNCTSLKSIVLPDSVTYMGYGLFMHCESLTEVTLPKGLKSIPGGFFINCDSLTTFEIPDSVTEIVENAFLGCDALGSVGFPENLTKIGSGAFANCTSLTTMRIPDTVTELGDELFSGCTSLTSVEFPAAITELPANTFTGCTALTSYAVPESVTAIGNQAFSECTALTDITFPEGLTQMGSEVFLNCTALQKITIPRGVTTLGANFFEGCTALTDVRLPDTMTEIGEWAFEDCAALERIRLPKALDTLGEFAFCDCHALQEIEFPASISTVGRSAFVNNVGLRKVVFLGSVDTIGNAAFANCTALTSVEIKGSAGTVDSSAFSLCEALSSVRIRGSVGGLGGSAFYGCSALSSFEVGGTVGNIGSYAFNDCTSLEEIVVNGGLTLVDRYAFEGCTALKRADLQCEAAVLGDYCFQGCTQLEELAVSDAVSIGQNAFYGCSSLKVMDIPEGVTAIGDSTFRGCTSLVKVGIPRGVTAIGSYAFYGCSALTGARLPDELTTLGTNAFYGCAALQTVYIPSGITKLNSSVFANCKSLKKAVILPGVESIQSSAFQNCPELTIYGYEGSYAQEYAAGKGFAFEIYDPNALPTVTMTVLDENGNIMESGYTVEWYVADALEGTGDVLYIKAAEYDYSCRVLLGDSLCEQYYQPSRIDIDLAGEPQDLSCTLRRIPKIELTGTLLNESGEPVAGTLRIEQHFSDTVTRELAVSAGADGGFALETAAVHVILTAQAEGYYTATMPLTLSGVTQGWNVGTICMRKMPENKIILAVQELDAARPGQVSTAAPFGNGENVILTVENLTRGTQVTEFTFQYPYLLLGEGQVDGNDTLRICATDPNDDAVSDTVTVELDAQASGRGVLTFTRRGSFILDAVDGDPQFRIMVFDADGRIVAAELANEGYRSMDLPEGSYRLVALERTDLLRSVPTLSALDAYGLVAGTDYAKLDLAVTDGVITVVDQLRIPDLDESRLYYTDPEHTSVTLNDTSSYAGKYLLLRVAYKLPEEYDAAGETVCIDLPKGIKAVDGSLSVDGTPTAFTVEDNRISIPVDRRDAVIRMYLFGSDAGKFSINAELRFELDGTTLTQPLGTAQTELVVATFTVPERVGTRTLTISGIAVPNSTITVYDGDYVAGTATSNAVGSWSARITLDPSRSLMTRVIRIRAENEVLDKPLISEPKGMIYDEELIEPLKVTMYCGSKRIVFDFKNPGSAPTYTWSSSSFTFLVELNRNDSPLLDRVFVRTINSAKKVSYVECFYDSGKDLWIGSSKFSSKDAPVGLDVQFVLKTSDEPLVDRDILDELEDIYDQAEDEVEDELDRLEKEIEDSVGLPDFDSMTTDDIIENSQNISKDMDRIQDETKQNTQSKLEGTGIRVEETENGAILDTGDRTIIYREEKLDRVEHDQLERDGYTVLELPGRKPIYVRKDEKGVDYIDGETGYKLVCELDKYQEDDPNTISDIINLNSIVGEARKLAKGDLGEIATYYRCMWGAVKRESVRLGRNIDELGGRIRKLQAVENTDPDVLKRYIKDYDDLVLKRKAHLRNLDKMAQQYKRYKIADRVAKIGGPLLDSVSVGMSIYSVYDTVGQTKALRSAYDSLGESCKNNDKYNSLKSRVDTVNRSMVVVSAASLVIDVASLVGGIVVTASTAGAGASALPLILSIGSLASQKVADQMLGSEYRSVSNALKTLDCDGDGIPDYEEYLAMLAMQARVIVDPSGYVYEAVPSNRLEGVKAEIYYKDGNQDVLWDAENYDQVNPLYTDAQGRYQWDVPFGLWLVKYSKEGYLDADSSDDPAADADGYLPVPPPQLDVNVGMISTAAPEVERVNVYQDQVQVIFSQYMKPDTVSLTVSCGGQTYTGPAESVNAEYNEEQTEQFATIFTFAPKAELRDMATVMISGAVNYAGTGMDADYVGTEPVTLRPTGITMTGETRMLYGDVVEIPVEVLPAAAGAGRTLTVVTSAPGLVDVAQQTVTCDAEGRAVITVIGSLPASAELEVCLDGTDLKCSGMVHVEQQTEDTCAKVTASIPGGSAVAYGTELTLSTRTIGAEIYYTLDGSCPCVEDSTSRIRYTDPILLTEDTFLIAYAVKEGLADSTTTGFVYTICAHPDTTLKNERKATCTADGYTGDRICDDCGTVLESGSVIPATGHSYETVVTAPSCTEQGYTTHTCHCGDSFVDTYTDALGHSYGAWNDAGNGMEERTCERCGHIEQRSTERPVNPFTDVPEGCFYHEPVLWAVEKGITAGTTPTTFSPNDQCMRAHVVTFLWRAVGSPEPVRTENPFVDVKPTDFYYKPVLWALENGITAGMDATHFGPTSACNRAQVVTFLYRAMGSPKVNATGHQFTDVAADGFYYRPMLWAVENGITAGLTATTFGPNAICNRAQIVTFLYRAYNK